MLDGEATPGERALVEGSVEGRARLAQLRAVAAAAAEPVAPLPSATVDALVGRALDAASTPTARTGRPLRPPGPSRPSGRRRAVGGGSAPPSPRWPPSWSWWPASSPWGRPPVGARRRTRPRARPRPRRVARSARPSQAVTPRRAPASGVVPPDLGRCPTPAGARPLHRARGPRSHGRPPVQRRLDLRLGLGDGRERQPDGRGRCRDRPVDHGLPGAAGARSRPARSGR